MSQLRTNSIVPVGGIPAGASGGGIIQIVQFTTTSVFGTTSTSYVDTPLSASITPRSTSNKILIILSSNVGNTNSNGGAVVNIVRGSTQIVEFGASYGSGTSSVTSTAGYTYLDSPATTLSTTYKIQLKTQSAASQVFLPIDFGGVADQAQLILMEVSG